VLRIKTGKRMYEGVEVQSYDPSVVVIKLKNGYNTGFMRDKVELEHLEERKKRVKRSERSILLGSEACAGFEDRSIAHRRPQKDICPPLFPIPGF